MQNQELNKLPHNLPETSGKNLILGKKYLIEQSFPGIPGKIHKYIGTFAVTNEEREAQNLNPGLNVKYGFTNVQHIPVSKKKSVTENLHKFYLANCDISDITQIPEVAASDLVPGTKYFIVRSPPRPNSFFGVFVEKLEGDSLQVFSNIVDVTPATYFDESRSKFYEKLTEENKQDIQGDAFCTEIFRRLTGTPEFTMTDFSTAVKSPSSNTYLSGKPESSFYPKGGKTRKSKKRKRKSKSRKRNKK